LWAALCKPNMRRTCSSNNPAFGTGTGSQKLAPPPESRPAVFACVARAWVTARAWVSRQSLGHRCLRSPPSELHWPTHALVTDHTRCPPPGPGKVIPRHCSDHFHWDLSALNRGYAGGRPPGTPGRAPNGLQTRIRFDRSCFIATKCRCAPAAVAGSAPGTPRSPYRGACRAPRPVRGRGAVSRQSALMGRSGARWCGRARSRRTRPRRGALAASRRHRSQFPLEDDRQSCSTSTPRIDIAVRGAGRVARGGPRWR
jgi:hypothetical protein